jgi:hypothetical protein
MYTRDAKRPLTESEFKLYQESLPVGNLIYSNTYTTSNKSGGNEEVETIEGYIDDDILYIDI